MNKGCSNGRTITIQNITKKGTGAITKNLNANANKTAVSTIFIFTPLKKDSTTFFDAVAPEYLKALNANTVRGIIATIPPIKTEKLVLSSHDKNETIQLKIIIIKDKIICFSAKTLPGLPKSCMILASVNYPLLLQTLKNSHNFETKVCFRSVRIKAAQVYLIIY